EFSVAVQEIEDVTEAHSEHDKGDHQNEGWRSGKASTPLALGFHDGAGLRVVREGMGVRRAKRHRRIADLRVTVPEQTAAADPSLVQSGPLPQIASTGSRRAAHAA